MEAALLKGRWGATAPAFPAWTKPLTGCRRCNREWADEATSIAAVHPELVAEWDAAGNGKRSPERIKATAGSIVVWKCRAEPDAHPPYAMSPSARANQLARERPGCPEGRRSLTERARKSPRRTTLAVPPPAQPDPRSLTS